MQPRGDIGGVSPARRFAAALSTRAVRWLPWVALFAALYVIGLRVPPGYDWKLNLSAGNPPPWWVPWARPLLLILNPAAIFALTLTSLAARCRIRNPSVLPIALAVLSLPTLWVLHLGDLGGLTITGLLALPWAVPLVLLKPQISSFALLANRKWLLAGICWVAISLLIWGLWPLRLLVVESAEWKATYPQDITLFPWGLVVAVPLLLLSRGDEDLLMAAGSLATPHLFPYHFIVLMPSLARMRTRWALATWLVTWLPLLSNWLGPAAWHLGNLASLAFWFGVRFGRERAVQVEKTSANALGAEGS